MLNNGNISNCEFTNEIVAYIYNEIGASERARFENHLSGCHECTNEFAGISNARLSVHEWRREEFADLSTPEIVIPYPAKRDADEAPISAGWFGGLRGLLSFANFPAAVAAGLVVCIGLGFVLLNYLGRAEENIASNITVPTSKANEKPVANPTVESSKPELAVESSPPEIRTEPQVRPIKAIERRARKNEKTSTPRTRANQNLLPTILNAPVLSENYEEAVDGSLRLSELFADGDS